MSEIDEDGEPAEQPEAGDGDDTNDPEASNEASQEASETEPADDDERPALEDDEKASLDLSGVDLDAVDEETPDAGESTDASDDATDDSATEQDDASGDLGTPDDGETWGDMYVDILAVVLVSIVDEYGDEDSDVSTEEIEELANAPPIALNEQANRLFEEMGGTKDLPPGQALAIGSATVAGSVLLRETNVASDLIDELGNRTEAI